MIIELLKAGRDRCLDEQGRPPLVEAAFPGHEDTAIALREAGADPNGADSDVALTEASSKGRVEVVKVLLAAGADVNATDRTGRTALAVSARDHLRMKRLIKRGAANC